MKEQKVNVFAEELDDLIEERVAHFTKWERYFEALDIDEENVQRTVASQVELIFNRLDDLEVDSRLTVLERKVNVFAEELDDLIEERVAHFTKWEVQRHKDLKGQVMELQEELVACKKELTRTTRQRCITVQPRRKKMPELRSYDGTREARQVDNLFWHLERYFEALDIDDEKEKVQMVVIYLNDTAALRWRRRYTDGYNVKTWEKFKHELQRQFYPDSVDDKPLTTEAERRIREYVKEYSALMLKIPEMSERQRLCFFFDGLQHWVTIELQRREPHDLASAMMIVERLGDFKQCERLRSPRHERAKGRGDGRSKSGSPKAADDERNEDEGRKEGQPEWMIPLVSKDGANARKGITVLQLDEGLTLCYVEWQMGPRTYAVDMLTKSITTEKFKDCLNLIHLLSC
ncbi:hypothetical protein RJ639_041053 [Escallonia herrerae]|uniref:Ty3 transposon capsid-like protein domain-containing protein n=1 Tax=Escallonia herrerae TaxID=1293975 RepID=A0AA88WGX7_9ASTE|nr:hypothetical protein RJ639_041053 [Escallonia herrerae]